MEPHGGHGGVPYDYNNANHIQPPQGGIYMPMIPPPPFPPMMLNGMYPSPMNPSPMNMGPSNQYMHPHHPHFQPLPTSPSKYHHFPSGHDMDITSSGHNSHRDRQSITLWIGKISTDITDSTIRSLLNIIGGLQSWKRTSDKMGQIRPFGFAEFVSPNYAIIAKSLLTDLRLGDSKILVKSDEKTQKVLDEFLKQYGQYQVKETSKEIIKDPPLEMKIDLKSFIELPSNQELFMRIKKMARSVNEGLGISIDELELDSSHLSVRDIRTNDIIDDMNINEKKKKSGSHLRDDWLTSREKEFRRDQDRKLERLHADHDREQRRLDIQKKEYRKLERKLEQDQSDRIYDLERRKSVEKDRMSTRSEDILMENRDMDDWYSRIGSSEFRHARKREREQDEIDEEEEKEREEEKEMKWRREEKRREEDLMEEESMKLLVDRSVMEVNGIGEKVDGEIRTELNISQLIQSKVESNLSPPIQIEVESNLAQPVKLQLHPRPNILTQNTLFEPPLSNKRTNSETQILSKRYKFEEGPESILDLIPQDRDELFSYQIDWDLLKNCQIHQSKIHPWVTKKMIEYLDSEEIELIDFICSLVAEQKPPQEIVSQLQLVLEEDSETFVIKLWRMILYEMLRLQKSTSL